MKKLCFTLLLTTCFINIYAQLFDVNQIPVKETVYTGKDGKKLNEGYRVYATANNALVMTDFLQKMQNGTFDYEFNVRIMFNEKDVQYKNATLSAPLTQSSVTVNVAYGGAYTFSFRLTHKEMEDASVNGIKFAIKYGNKIVNLTKDYYTIPAKDFAEVLNQVNNNIARANKWYEWRQKTLNEQAAQKQQQANQEANKIVYYQKLATQMTTDAAPYMKKGTGKISGQAFLKTIGGDVKLGAGNEIMIYPFYNSIANISDAMDSVRQKLIKPLPENVLSTFKKVTRYTVSDANGNFEFTNLPPGTYIIETVITWQYEEDGFFEGDTYMKTAGGRVWKKVEIANAESKKVMLTW